MFDDSTSQFFSNNGVRIHYRRYGSGPLLVFVHGHPDNEQTWNYQVDEFAKDHTVILFTLRGFPPSDVPKDENAYEGNILASDLVAMLDHLSIDKAIFAGHDIGGILVQKLVLLHPERVSGLIIFNTLILPKMLHLINQDPEQQALSKFSLRYFTQNPGDEQYDIDYTVRLIPDPSYRAAVKRYLQGIPEWGMFYFFKKNYPGPPYGQPVDTSSIRYEVPSMIIWGMKEPYVVEIMLDTFYKWFNSSVRVVTLPDAGHWAFREDPQKVNNELRSWLTELHSGRL
jgi:pimeloyl-ACP methyl ester carboxylesterase